jgi:hypothetical protein
MGVATEPAVLCNVIFAAAAFSAGTDTGTKHLTVRAMNAGFNTVFLFGACLGVMIFLLTFVVPDRKANKGSGGGEEAMIPGDL